jgi:hypothetical protein
MANDPGAGGHGDGGEKKESHGASDQPVDAEAQAKAGHIAEEEQEQQEEKKGEGPATQQRADAAVQDRTHPDARAEAGHADAAPREGEAQLSQAVADGARLQRQHCASVPPPPSSRLYRHMLECIFAFLECGELAASLRVSKGWLAAAQSMSSLQLQVVLSSKSLLTVPQSTLRRHIAVLGDSCARMVLTAEFCSIVARHMAHIRCLTGWLHPSLWPGLLTLPAALRQLDLRVPRSSLHAALEAIGCLPLLESLTLRFLHAVDSTISFAPLAAAPQLRSLDLSWVRKVGLSDVQVDELRALTRLHTIRLPRMPMTLLHRLLRQPHALQWQEMVLNVPLRDEVAALLPQLPFLTALCLGAVTCTRFDWLRALPHLTALDVGSHGNSLALLSALSLCAGLASLLLRYADDHTAAHLADFLPRLPSLRCLKLFYLQTRSLRFLAQQPTALQLTSLHLILCQYLSLSELRHVHALSGLTSLHLVESFDEPLDAHSRSLLEPPSLFLPQLEDFMYSSPEED